jgi:predicted acetyltransferase
MTADRGADFDAMLAEFCAAGETDVYQGDFAIAWKGYALFYDLISKMKNGGYPKPDIVPMDSYFIEREGQVLGDIYIRPRLSAGLQKFGGNIGYRVRPSERNRGVATVALKLALAKLAAIGVDRALLTCRETNAASARVIEKCGGVRAEDSHGEHGVSRRYWVPTRAAAFQ